MRPLLVTALLGAAAPALATPPPVSSATGFHLLLVPRDGPARALQMIHTGAGLSRAVAGELSGDELVFYSNGTSKADGTLVTDVGEQGFPMAFSFDGSGGDEVLPVDVSVGEPTRGLFVDDEEYDPWVRYTAGGRFWMCEQFVEYYQTTYPVLNWSEDEEVGAEDCERVAVVPVCDVLEELPEGAIGSHEFVREVRCFVDNQSASQSTRA